MSYCLENSSRISAEKSSGNLSAKSILKEIRSIKSLIKPSKKSVRVIKPASIQNSLTKAVKHSCSNDVKFLLVEYIQRNNGKKESDEIAKEIGLNTAKQIRKRLPVGQSKERVSVDKSVPRKDGKAPEKKVKTDKPAEEHTKAKAASKSPVKSPIKKDTKEAIVPETDHKKAASKEPETAKDSKKPATKGKKK